MKFLTINNCSACSKDHDNLLVFTIPDGYWKRVAHNVPEDFKNFIICPNTGLVVFYSKIEDLDGEKHV